MQSVEFVGEFITLSQLIKKLSFVSSGGEVKHFLDNRSILVNGEKENRRGRKIRHGDLVSIDGKLFRLE